MAEWQTRKLEVFVGRPVLVQVQLSAPIDTYPRYLFLTGFVCAFAHSPYGTTSTFVLCTRVLVRHFTMSATRDIWLHHIDKSSHPHQNNTLFEVFFCFSSYKKFKQTINKYFWWIIHICNFVNIKYIIGFAK